ncbi:MAG: UDP-N-acetylglucosamine 2-epimerase (non-hydrolyzing) [Acidimicrobiia bacterium]|nr:MAG: UDP-N-acetylglucosamine 2-epimerase (non-hydrolyzing) [Acidimicrobiia bacterium]
MIHVFIGTKAQYIKTAPILREMDRRGVSYRLVDSGQHGEFSNRLRRTLGVRDPDLFVGGSRDITTISSAALWAVSLSLLALRRQRLRDEVFAGDVGGVCVVHGDTPTTYLSAMLAKRAGLLVAHLESGLRSRSILHPFPEELIRLRVMRSADVLFAPDDAALKNLAAMRIRGAIVPTGGNTSIEALAYALRTESVGPTGPAVLTTHRVENLKNRDTMDHFVSLLESVASRHSTVFVVHPPTEIALERFGLMERVRLSGADVQHLVDHADFVRMIARAPFVVSDGGSIQEECALIGVPTLVWRKRTERPDGIKRNVVLAHFDDVIISDFLRSYDALRRPPRAFDATPSRVIVDVLEGWS